MKKYRSHGRRMSEVERCEFTTIQLEAEQGVSSFFEEYSGDFLSCDEKGTTDTFDKKKNVEFVIPQ